MKTFCLGSSPSNLIKICLNDWSSLPSPLTPSKLNTIYIYNCPSLSLSPPFHFSWDLKFFLVVPLFLLSSFFFLSSFFHFEEPFYVFEFLPTPFNWKKMEALLVFTNFSRRNKIFKRKRKEKKSQPQIPSRMPNPGLWAVQSGLMSSPIQLLWAVLEDPRLGYFWTDGLLLLLLVLHDVEIDLGYFLVFFFEHRRGLSWMDGLLLLLFVLHDVEWNLIIFWLSFLNMPWTFLNGWIVIVIVIIIICFKWRGMELDYFLVILLNMPWKIENFKKGWTKLDAAPGLPGRSPIPVLFRPKGA